MITSGLVQFHDDLEPLLIPIDSIRPHPENPKNGDVSAILSSIEMNGFYRPVYAQKSTGYILAGNHSTAAALELGAELIPVVWLDVNDTTARKILLADNRTADLGQYDNGVLASLLNKIQIEDSLYGTGYVEADLEQLKALSEIPLDTDDFAMWPTITVRVPPHVRAAYMKMTDNAVGDRERFELMLRLAGWDGRK